MDSCVKQPSYICVKTHSVSLVHIVQKRNHKTKKIINQIATTETHGFSYFVGKTRVLPAVKLADYTNTVLR